MTSASTVAEKQTEVLPEMTKHKQEVLSCAAELGITQQELFDSLGSE